MLGKAPLPRFTRSLTRVACNSTRTNPLPGQAGEQKRNWLFSLDPLSSWVWDRCLCSISFCLQADRVVKVYSYSFASLMFCPCVLASVWFDPNHCSSPLPSLAMFSRRRVSCRPYRSRCDQKGLDCWTVLKILRRKWSVSLITKCDLVLPNCHVGMRVLCAWLCSREPTRFPQHRNCPILL